jgi:hypothetical protein
VSDSWAATIDREKRDTGKIISPTCRCNKHPEEDRADDRQRPADRAEAHCGCAGGAHQLAMHHRNNSIMAGPRKTRVISKGAVQRLAREFSVRAGVVAPSSGQWPGRLCMYCTKRHVQDCGEDVLQSARCAWVQHCCARGRSLLQGCSLWVQRVLYCCERVQPVHPPSLANSRRIRKGAQLASDARFEGQLERARAWLRHGARRNSLDHTQIIFQTVPYSSGAGGMRARVHMQR